MKVIETESLTKYYGKARGIIDASFSVDEGDFFGFIGPNGAGKSTMIRTLLGLISATSGSAKIFGKDIKESKKEILSRIGYLPSETMFYNGMRVKDVLRFSANLRRKDCKDEAEKLCERLQLDPSRKIDELSLGNRKKVGIVCAMQHNPELYIMDEPTSGLDPLMQHAFYELLMERNQEGATVFLSSHILSEIQKYCKKATVIREGRILVTDTVENLGNTGAKRVEISGVESIPNLENVCDLKIENQNMSFLYSGDMNHLMKQLAQVTIKDLTISEPSLEEVFMHYYEKEEK